MVDSVDGKKNVGKLTSTKNITGTNEVNSTSQTQSVGKIGATKEIGGVTSITPDNIEKIRSMVSELSSQMFKNVPAEKRDIIERAVQMALDAAKADK